MKDCIFCKIINGEIPCAKVYEDDKTFCFLDIAPGNKGHCLVVPKHHCQNYLEIPESDLEAFASTVKKVALSVSKALNSEFNLVMNNGKNAGQIVFHAHMHIIPRFENDGIKIETRALKYNSNEIHEFAEKIKRNIDG
jgi:histidine triad (HIT) family protein